MPTAGSSAKVYGAGYDLTAFLKEAGVSVETAKLDTTVFGQVDRNFIPGLQDASISEAGLYDDTATTGIDAVLAAIDRVADQVWVHLPNGDTHGAVGRGMVIAETSYKIESPTDDVNAISFGAQVSGGTERVVVHHILQAEGSSANGTSVDNAASSANGGVGYLQVTDVSAGTHTVKIQHSADDSTWADLIEFTGLTGSSDHTAERIAVSGTVNRYTRAIVTVSGGTPTFHVAFGRKSAA